jgi:hypothetical protein
VNRSRWCAGGALLVALSLAACGLGAAGTPTTDAASHVAVSAIHASWTLRHPKETPPAGSGGVEAYDQATNQLILFGADQDYKPVDPNTWLWTGTSWSKLHPTNRPPAANQPVMAYDGATRQLVLFGGVLIPPSSSNSNPTYSKTTWLWNGRNWSEAHPALSPPARCDAVMAFDPKSGQLLLFGGASFSNFGDTWSWTGSTWRQLHPSASPPDSFAQALAYDPVDGGLVLLGGVPELGEQTPFLGTWLWNGKTWAELSPADSPRPRADAGLGWDQSARVLVAFGGFDQSYVQLSDTWIWTGTTWAELHPSEFPERRAPGGQFAYDPKTHQFVLFGGFKGSGRPSYGDTWTLRLTS